jgi:hydroxymethylpyrimidine pyrophosphatase-like HAD family hydrolase
VRRSLSSIFPPHNAVAVGDAENDHAFFNICECAVAVANALPPSRRKPTS